MSENFFSLSRSFPVASHSKTDNHPTGHELRSDRRPGPRPHYHEFSCPLERSAREGIFVRVRPTGPSRTHSRAIPPGSPEIRTISSTSGRKDVSSLILLANWSYLYVSMIRGQTIWLHSSPSPISERSPLIRQQVSATCRAAAKNSLSATIP